MYKGTVKFRTRIKGNGLTFPLFEFNPNEPGVDKVEVEGPNGDEILSTVHLASVASHEDGKAIATKVNTTALNRISFSHGIAIQNSESTGVQFSPLDPRPGVLEITAGNYVITGDTPKLVSGIPAALLKTELEQLFAAELLRMLIAE